MDETPELDRNQQPQLSCPTRSEEGASKREKEGAMKRFQNYKENANSEITHCTSLSRQFFEVRSL